MMESEFIVTIDQFQGPLDLMLHLIKEKKLDLFNLNLSILTDQYVAYIRTMDQMNLEIASEYLTEMASLLEYKSKRLLPKDKSELEDNYEEDTREKLVKRLIEYQKFKEVSEQLQKRGEERSQQYVKPESNIANQWRKELSTEVFSNDGNMSELLKAMNQCIRRYQIMQPLPVQIAHKEISAEERATQLKQIMAGLPDTFYLEDLCADCADVYLVIVTFLAVLDMIKTGDLLAKVIDQRIFLRQGAGYGTN